MKEQTLLFRECHMSFASFFQLLHNGFDTLKATYQFIHYFCEFLGMPLKKKETSALLIQIYGFLLANQFSWFIQKERGFLIGHFSRKAYKY